MFVAASTHCFAELDPCEACHQLGDLEYDKVELWFGANSPHAQPGTVAADPEAFVARYRDTTRLTPVAISLEDDVDTATFDGLVRICKLLRITQITIPASPVGTPFNTEIDRLRGFLRTASEEGIRLSIKTRTGQLSEDPRTAVELCQSVRGLGITLDPSYYMCGPHREESYDIVLPHVFHVHLRDSTPEQLQVQVGLGEIDYNRLIAQLQRVSYNLALSVEMLPELLAAEDRPLEMRKLRMLLDSLL